MFIDDIVKSVVDVASDVVETVTGGLINPGELLNAVFESPIDDIIAIGAGLALTGNPVAFTPLAEELESILTE